jgi:hypothetical protein
VPAEGAFGLATGLVPAGLATGLVTPAGGSEAVPPRVNWGGKAGSGGLNLDTVNEDRDTELSTTPGRVAGAGAEGLAGCSRVRAGTAEAGPLRGGRVPCRPGAGLDRNAPPGGSPGRANGEGPRTAEFVGVTVVAPTRAAIAAVGLDPGLRFARGIGLDVIELVSSVSSVVGKSRESLGMYRLSGLVSVGSYPSRR